MQLAKQGKVRSIFGKDDGALSLQDFSRASALVADPNAVSRAILVGQMREMGVGTVMQVSRLADARAQLELREFDFVLCEREFPDEEATGEALLEDLRREQLIPFHTVFVMLTARITYAQAAEAAESALDSFLIKPHKASELYERVLSARKRKSALLPIFQRIDAGDFEGAADLCIQRARSRQEHWLYAARLGAELMIRLGKTAEAQELYEEVLAARALPWAKLGIARAQLDAGQTSAAIGTLENLLLNNADYADAYDVMARAHLEAGNLEQAMKTYGTAASLTPGSVVRLQKHAMVAFYLGQIDIARTELKNAALKASESRLFDHQALVLLAFTQFVAADREELAFCRSMIERTYAEQAHSERVRRFSLTIEALDLAHDQQMGAALDRVSEIAGGLMTDGFDFEAASNLISLMAVLSMRQVDLGGLENVVQQAGLRFCGTTGASDMLCNAAMGYEPYQTKLRECHEHVSQIAQKALALSLQGDAQASVQRLMASGSQLKSARLVDVAYLVLQRHHDRIDDAVTLLSEVESMKRAFGGGFAKPTVGKADDGSGGIKIRMGSTAPRRKAARFTDASRAAGSSTGDPTQGASDSDFGPDAAGDSILPDAAPGNSSGEASGGRAAAP